MTAQPESPRALARSPHALLETLRTTDFAEMGRELERLLAVEKWARAQLGFAEGDRVRLRDTWRFPDQADSPGWWHYRECLVPGATAEAVEVKFSPYLDGWRVSIRLDQEWAVVDPSYRDGSVKRYWHGPAASTPEGYEPPGSYDQEHYPGGTRHLFMMRPESLERIA